MARSEAKREEWSSAGRRGEAEQIIDDDVNRAADGVGGKIVEVERFRPNSLTCEGGVAMQSDRQHTLPALRANARLFGARAAHGHRIHGFQMTRIRDEMNFDAASGRRAIFSGGADVILDVAASQHAARVNVFEVGKNLGRRTADDVHHHVEPPAMAHRDNHLLGAGGCGRFHDAIEQRNQRSDSFERVALGSDKTRLQSLLEEFGAKEPLENALLVAVLRRADAPCGQRSIRAVPDPRYA